MIFQYLFSLTYGLTIVPEALEDKISNWSFNPGCPTEDAARECEDVCFTANANCINDCGGNTECIRQCSRDFESCIEVCPCYSGCFDGCPCPHETVYCDSCLSRYEKEYSVCRDLEKQNLDVCLDNCPTFNQTTCNNECIGRFNYQIRVRFNQRD